MNAFAKLLLFALLFSFAESSCAWNIGSKGRVVGPAIHTTYFLTANNVSFTVHAMAYVGLVNNGNCTIDYNRAYDLGTEQLRSGDFIDIDGFQLLSLIGERYSCMTIFYVQKQIRMETFQIYFDGMHYIGSNPNTSEVTIL